MRGTVTVYEIKPLKGPDRLLRLHVLINGVTEMKDNIIMLGEIAKSLLYRYHNLTLVFPVEHVFNAIPNNPKQPNFKFGEFISGCLGIEILFNYRSESEFKIRYYTPELEFERKIKDVNLHIELNKIDMDDYKFKHTISDLRNGVNTEPFYMKIEYSSSE